LIRTIDPQAFSAQPNVNRSPPCAGFLVLRAARWRLILI